MVIEPDASANPFYEACEALATNFFALDEDAHAVAEEVLPLARGRFH